jgi:hypothetical protein
MYIYVFLCSLFCIFLVILGHYPAHTGTLELYPKKAKKSQ